MQTKRLYLRHQSPELLSEVLNKTISDQMVFFGTETKAELSFELEKVKAKIKKGLIKNWVKWDLISIVSGDVIGSCGFHNWQPEHEKAEIGYLLHERFRKQGFMTEALNEIIIYGFEEMNLNRIEAFISPLNTPSLHVVKSLCFTYEGTLRQHYKQNDIIHDSEVYSLLKSEYTKS